MSASAPGVLLSSTEQRSRSAQLEPAPGTTKELQRQQESIMDGASCLETPAPLGNAGPPSQRPSGLLMLLRASPGVYSHFPSPSESLFSIFPPPSHLFSTDFASHSSTSFHLSSVPPVLFSIPLSSLPLFSHLQSPLCLSAFSCCRKQGAWNPCAAQTGKKPLASKTPHQH